MDYVYDGEFNPPNDFGVRQVVATTHTLDPGGPNEAIIDARGYTWDEMFNKTQRADVRAAATGQRLTHDYLYDSAYRMKQATVTDMAAAGGPANVRATTYDLDGVHNRLSTNGMVDPAAGDYTMNIGSGNCTITNGIPGTPIDEADRAMNQYTTTPFDLRG